MGKLDWIKDYFSPERSLADYVMPRGRFSDLLANRFKGVPRKICGITRVYGGTVFYHVRFSNGDTLGLTAHQIRRATKKEMKRVG